MQAVPTGMVRGPDGALYVGQLTGFPFPVGGANVYRIVRGGEPEVYASGFTTITDIGFDERGRLYVLQAIVARAWPAPSRRARSSASSATARTRRSSRASCSRRVSTIRGHVAYVSNNGPVPHGGEVLRVKLGGWHR